MPRGSVWQDEADGRLRFVVPIEYTNTWVVFTFEGLTYSVAAGESPNLSNVWFWGQAPIAVTSNTASYRVPLSAGLPYTIDAGSFQWPTNLLATSTATNQIQTESGLCTNYLVTSTNAHRLAFGSFRYEPIVAWFDVKAGEINHGWDPMGPEPWTSVGVCRTNEIVELYIHPIEATNLVELVVTTGTSSVNVTPTNFTAQVTGLTIQGMDTPHADAIIEARLRDTGNSLARLHAMVLPWQTLTLAIYRVTDDTAPDTSPVDSEGNASTAALTNTLNAVFRQACIDFQLTGSGNTNLHYDIGGVSQCAPTEAPDGRLQELERHGIHPDGAWFAQVRVFLVRNSGRPYWESSCCDAYARGFSQQNGNWSIVFTENAKANGVSYADQTTAHEVGHQIALADAIADGGHHDIGLPPPGAECLMKSGQPINCQVTVPMGRWIRHGDWFNANEAAKKK